MKSFAICISAALSLVAHVCPAQKWEVGGVTGGGFGNSLTVSNPTGSASTGFSPGVAVGGIIGQNLYRQIGGELRYTFQFSNLKLSGGGSELPSGDRRIPCSTTCSGMRAPRGRASGPS